MVHPHGGPGHWNQYSSEEGFSSAFTMHTQMMLHGTICATDTKTTLMFEVVSELTLPVTEAQSKHHMLFVSVCLPA